MPDGVFNNISGKLDKKEFVRLHQILTGSEECRAHWGTNLRKYAHHANGPLFEVIESKEALRWALARGINVQNFQLKIDGESHECSFRQVCEDGDLDLVRAIVESRR